MSDIGINLSGFIALLVFFWAAVGLAFAGLVSLLIAYVRRSGGGVKKHGAYSFFLAALPLIVVNLIAFGVLVCFVDSNERGTNEFLDRIALFAWLPFQLVEWIVLGLIIKKVRS